MALTPDFNTGNREPSPAEFAKLLRSLEELNNRINNDNAAREQGPVGIAHGAQGWGIRHTTGGDVVPGKGLSKD